MKKLLITASSGGIDSTTLIYKGIEEGFTILPINFNYGQHNDVEIHAQKRVMEHIKIEYNDQLMETLYIDLNDSLKGPLDQARQMRNIKVEEDAELSFYMPSRNMVFASLIAMIGEIVGEAQGFDEIHIGLGIHKHSDNYPRDYWDITPEFAKRIQLLLDLNDNMNVQIYTPYVDKTKSEIMTDAWKMKVPINLTWSCYNPVEKFDKFDTVYSECLNCEACLEKRNILKEVDYIEFSNFKIDSDQVRLSTNEK